MPQRQGWGRFQAIETKDGRAVLHCQETDDCFGPIFASLDEAGEFVRWLRQHPAPRLVSQAGLAGDDPRQFAPPELKGIVSSFRQIQAMRKGA